MKEERCILIVDDDRESTHLTQKDGGDVEAQIEGDPGMQRAPIIFLTRLVTKAEAKAGVHIEGHPVVAKLVGVPIVAILVSLAMLTAVAVPVFRHRWVLPAGVRRLVAAPVRV